MFNRIFITTLTASAILLFSCKKDTPPNNTETNEEETTDTLELTNLKPVGDDCTTLGDFEFCSLGFSFIKFGDSLYNKNIKFENATRLDTVYQSKGFAWRGIEYDFGNGKLKFESDFAIGELLNRVIISTPNFVSSKGIRVGSTMGDLRAKYPDLIGAPMDGFPYFEIASETFPYILFHFDKKDGTERISEVSGLYKLDDISNDAKIVQIVMQNFDNRTQEIDQALEEIEMVQ